MNSGLAILLANANMERLQVEHKEEGGNHLQRVFHEDEMPAKMQQNERLAQTNTELHERIMEIKHLDSASLL